MERDFMGLNWKEPEIVVKEEAVEGCKDSVFPKSSGVPWPLSSKVSALPHFMPFKAAQDEKIRKVMPDQLASSGFMALSSADAFDVNHKRQYAEVQRVHSMHLIPDAKMLTMSMSNPFLKTHFAGTGQNFAGATSRQVIGGVPVAAPCSVIPSSNFVAATTEPLFNTKTSGTPAQLTIFYAGTVNVYEDITPEKAQAIMFLAGTGCLSPNMAQPRVQVQSPPTKLTPQDAAFVNQPINTPPSSALSSPISVSSHPVSQPGGTATKNDEVRAAPKVSGMVTNHMNKVEIPKIATSLGPVTATTMIPSAVPQARKASLARFLEKRKERVMNSAPYNLSKKSTENIDPESNVTGLSALSVAGSSPLSTGKD